MRNKKATVDWSVAQRRKTCDYCYIIVCQLAQVYLLLMLDYLDRDDKTRKMNMQIQGNVEMARCVFELARYSAPLPHAHVHGLVACSC